MPDLNKEEEHFIKCECGVECLHIEQDSIEKDIYFSLWYYGIMDMTWRHKLDWIWAIIKGKPYCDAVIVKQERISEIIEVLEGMKEKK